MKIKKVLLVIPPSYTFKSYRDINPLPPIGLGYLASILEGLDIEVKILDCLVRGWYQEKEVDDKIVQVGLAAEEIKEQVRGYDPDLVGLSCQFSRQYKMYHQVLGAVKEAKPGVITVAGGAHVSVCPGEVLEDPCCDFVLIGEAEESFKELISALVQGSDLEVVDGLGWKTTGSLKINDKKRWLKNLDAIPFPAYHLMELERYFGLPASHGQRHRHRFCPIVTSRGCPAKCTFCSARRVWGDRYRFRSVENVIQEMRLLKSQFGIEELMFEDDNVTANPKRARRLFAAMTQERFNFIWDTPNGIGVWSIDEALIDLMRQSGCINLNFPVESGSQEILDKVIQKPLNLDKVKQLIAYCKKINLDCNMFLVVGMPGEKIGDIWKSFQFAADCGCYNPHISVATPYPGTQLLKKCQAEGYLAREFVLDDLFIRSFMINTPEWSERELRQILLKGQLYLLGRMALEDPGALLGRVAIGLKNPGRLLTYLRRIIDPLLG
jgi:anaerobic magnesium-protoporphyrin IX monomethyl ester cyclase